MTDAINQQIDDLEDESAKDKEIVLLPVTRGWLRELRQYFQESKRLIDIENEDGQDHLTGEEWADLEDTRGPLLNAIDPDKAIEQLNVAVEISGGVYNDVYFDADIPLNVVVKDYDNLHAGDDAEFYRNVMADKSLSESFKHRLLNDVDDPDAGPQDEGVDMPEPDVIKDPLVALALEVENDPRPINFKTCLIDEDERGNVLLERVKTDLPYSRESAIRAKNLVDSADMLFVSVVNLAINLEASLRLGGATDDMINTHPNLIAAKRLIQNIQPKA